MYSLLKLNEKTNFVFSVQVRLKQQNSLLILSSAGVVYHSSLKHEARMNVLSQNNLQYLF